MYFYLKSRTQSKLKNTIIYFSLCVFAGLAAALSKENAVMLPVSILVFDLFLIQGFNKENVLKLLKIAVLPLIVILIFGFLYTDLSAILDGYKIRDFTLVQRLLTETRIMIFYLSLLFYPINSRLTLLYDVDISTSLFQPWTTITSILLIVALIGLAFYLAKKRPLISFCIIFYFLNHLIEGSIFALELIYEHRNYLPSMFLFLLPAEFCLFALNYFSYKKTIQLFVSFGIILLLFGLGATTYRRNAIVSNDDKLWLDNINKYPNLSRPHSNLGNTYIYCRLTEKGFQEYEKAMSANNFGSVYALATQEHNLGRYYFQEGKYNKALPYFEESYKVLDNFLANPLYISKIKILQNKLSEAHSVIEQEFRKYPTNIELIEIFSLILFKEGKYQEAEICAKKALMYNIASAFPLTILAENSRNKGNYQSAINLWCLYQKTYPLNPHANLALIELYAKTDNEKMLNEELAKLNCYIGTNNLRSYIDDLLKDNNPSAYVPDAHKIIAIVNARGKY
jgi:tetratricopeptide (TPR) repeat protein